MSPSSNRVVPLPRRSPEPDKRTVAAAFFVDHWDFDTLRRAFDVPQRQRPAPAAAETDAAGPAEAAEAPPPRRAVPLPARSRATRGGRRRARPASALAMRLLCRMGLAILLCLAAALAIIDAPGGEISEVTREDASLVPAAPDGV